MRVTVEDETGKKVIIDGTGKSPATAAEPWDGTSIAARLIKAAPARRYSLHVAYPANKPDTRIAADGYRDFAGAEAIEDAAWHYMLKGRQIGLWHAGGTEGAGDCVESYIYRGPDWVIKAADGTQQTIRAGDWLIGIVWHPDVWPKVLKGEIGGVSMQGSASRRRPSRESIANLRR